MADINYIVIRPADFGWNLWVYPDDIDNPTPIVFGIGDAIQFHHEVNRTLGKWIADGPADFHASAPYDQETDDVRLTGVRWWREEQPKEDN